MYFPLFFIEAGKSNSYQLKFLGSERPFVLDWFQFVGESYTPTVSVDDHSRALIKSFTLEQNYPNPFNPTTQIKYSLPKNGKVSLKIFNLSGKEITTLVDGIQTKGEYTVTFYGSNLATGVYFIQLKADNFKQTRKMLIQK